MPSADAVPSGAPLAHPLPRVLLVAGPDVDARLDLMRALSTSFEVGAVGSRPNLSEKFLAAGYRYTAYRLTRKVNPILDLLTLAELTIRFRRLKPQVVHAFDTKPAVWACLAARLAGVPVVVGTVTGLGSLYTTGGARMHLTRAVYQILQRLASRASDAVLFQNPDDARQFIDERLVAPSQAATVPGSGVSTEEFDLARIPAAELRRVRLELGAGPGDVLVTMVSRVIRSKGVLEFAAAARQVCAARPHARFVLIGDADRESLDRLTEDDLEGLRQVVHWPGRRGDIPVVLAASDLFVFPSQLREGIPRVLLEAAAMALPIVTVDAPGCSDVVEHERSGLLVPVRDPQALATAIVRLVEAPDLRDRYGRAARARVEERFALAKVAGETANLYARLLRRKGLPVTPPVSTSPSTRAARGLFSRRGRPASKWLKRLIDVSVSALALVVAGPLMLLAAIAVKGTSPGPVIYRARRAGLGGRPFDMFKFRTMRAGTDTQDRKITAPQDNRVTNVGAVLRRFRIDELPQLWNVLRGDMSIVGPRPEDWEIVQAHYRDEDRRSLQARPGMVAPADVRWYPDLAYHDPPPPGVSAQEYYVRRHLPIQVAEGVRYVEEQSLLQDLQVIGQAIFCVVVRSWWSPKRRPVPLGSWDTSSLDVAVKLGSSARATVDAVTHPGSRPGGGRRNGSLCD